MPSAVLFRSTPRGTIELAVSDRTAAHTGVARDDQWGREFRPRTPDEWAEKLKRMDAADRKREERHRRREAPMTDTGGSAGSVVEAFPLEPDAVAIEARRGRPKKGKGKGKVAPYPNAGRWFLLCCRDRESRDRGVPGNAAMGGGRGSEA